MFGIVLAQVINGLVLGFLYIVIAQGLSSTMPANARSKWPSAAWASPPAPTTACSKSPAPSPISINPPPSPPSTSPKPFSTAASTAITGRDGISVIQQTTSQSKILITNDFLGFPQLPFRRAWGKL